MIKCAISNIGWGEENDIVVYELMKRYGFSGLEIAPTRVFPERPYDLLDEAHIWSKKLNSEFGFIIPSMQSIWYGRQEKIFGSEEERAILVDYTTRAIDFAAVIDCKNLVFGCPRNRNLPDGADESLAIAFFKKLGDYAVTKGRVIGMEANPPIYNTNYINGTQAAIEIIEQVDSEGFKLNLDVGTMIQNGEDVPELIGKVHLINHVHISEPGLKPIEKRTIHNALRKVLEDEGYQGFISIEMGKADNIAIIEDKLAYVRGIFS